MIAAAWLATVALAVHPPAALRERARPAPSLAEVRAALERGDGPRARALLDAARARGAQGAGVELADAVVSFREGALDAALDAYGRALGQARGRTRGDVLASLGQATELLARACRAGDAAACQAEARAQALAAAPPDVTPPSPSR